MATFARNAETGLYGSTERRFVDLGGRVEPQGKLIFGTETLTATGNVDANVVVTMLDASAGALVATLGSGELGQVKWFICTGLNTTCDVTFTKTNEAAGGLPVLKTWRLKKVGATFGLVYDTQADGVTGDNYTLAAAWRPISIGGQSADVANGAPNLIQEL